MHEVLLVGSGGAMRHRLLQVSALASTSAGIRIDLDAKPDGGCSIATARRGSVGPLVVVGACAELVGVGAAAMVHFEVAVGEPAASTG